MWDELTLPDKARMIKLAVDSGITNLRDIHEVYNKFAGGGPTKGQKLIDRINRTSQADFVKRLQDENRKYIDYGDSIATHRMAYATDDEGRAIVYPEVQSVGDTLQWFRGRDAIDRAIENRDTLMMSIPEAEWFTTHYKDYYPKGNTFAEGGPVYTSTAEIPATIVTPDRDYNIFLNSLPDNQKFTPEEDYSTRRYWELNGKPRDFEAAKKLGMYIYDSSDNSYHANTVAWGDDGIGYFMKPKHHDTLQYELDWYNDGLITEEGGEQHRATGKEEREWRKFRNNYILDTSGNFYKYLPKKQ
jgi:hypothetical protein